MVSVLTFKYLIHFELIFVSAVQFHLSAYGESVFTEPLLKIMPFPHCVFLMHLSKISQLYIARFISGLLSLLSWPTYLFLC